jgi:hypothetical protein
MKDDEEDRESKEVPARLSEQAYRSIQPAKFPTNRLAHPKGVFRFCTFEEFNEWKEKFVVGKSPQDPT